MSSVNRKKKTIGCEDCTSVYPVKINLCSKVLTRGLSLKEIFYQNSHAVQKLFTRCVFLNLEENCSLDGLFRSKSPY